jgi:hypothetical protein
MSETPGKAYEEARTQVEMLRWLEESAERELARRRAETREAERKAHALWRKLFENDRVTA